MRSLDAVLAAIFLLGVQSVVFGLIPLRFLDGDKLRNWSQLAWVLVYGAGVFFFVHLLVLNRRDLVGQGTAPAFFSTLALFLDSARYRCSSGRTSDSGNRCAGAGRHGHLSAGEADWLRHGPGDAVVDNGGIGTGAPTAWSHNA